MQMVQMLNQVPNDEYHFGMVVPRRVDHVNLGNKEDGPGKFKRDLYYLRYLALTGVAPVNYPNVVPGVLNVPMRAGERRPLVCITKKNMVFPGGQELGGEHYNDGCVCPVPDGAAPQPTDPVFLNWKGNKNHYKMGDYHELLTGNWAELWARPNAKEPEHFVAYIIMMPNSLHYTAEGEPKACFLLHGLTRQHFEVARSLFP